MVQVTPPTSGPSAWGFVFYQGDELLHQKRPVADETSVLASELPNDDVRTDCALLCLGQAKGQAFRPQDIGPFRYRRWAYAASRRGDVDARVRDTLLDSLPDHLRRGVTGTTVDEAIFAAILAEIHEAGSIDDPDLPASPVEEAIRRALDRAGLRADGGDAFAAVLTSGVRTFGIARGIALDHASHFQIGSERGRSTDLRVTLLLDAEASAPAEGFQHCAERAIITIDRDLTAREAVL